MHPFQGSEEFHNAAHMTKVRADCLPCCCGLEPLRTSLSPSGSRNKKPAKKLLV